MSWEWEWVVEIGRRIPDEQDPRQIGTGAVIGPNRILTARHVVFDKSGNLKPDLRVRRAGGGRWKDATWVEWTREHPPGGGPLDVALLDAEIDGTAHLPRGAILAVRDVVAHSRWEAKGYPRIADEIGNTELKSVTGTTTSCTVGSRCLELNADSLPEVAGGLSGAPVVVDGRVVGVMHAVPKKWEGKLEATPVAAFLDDPGFRDALGLRAEDERLAGVVKEVADMLEKHPAVAAALVKMLKLTTRPERPEDVGGIVARELVRACRATDAAEALNDADSALAESNADPKDRDAVRSLLWRILPFAVDWQQLVVSGARAIRAGSKAIDLPLRSETVAEIVLAGIDERSCKFVPNPSGALPVGAALVRVPVAAQALIDADCAHLARAVVKQLGAETCLDADFPKYSDLRIAVDFKLYRDAERVPTDRRLARYFLFKDADLPAEDGGPDLWALVKTALGQELKNLRLVRLTGGSLQLENELPVAYPIQDIFKRSP
jgi:hypothetical protein